MINIEKYNSELISLLKLKFENRLLYVGLQGSYMREEETENSDIDIMVIIEGLSVTDLDVYRSIIQSMDHYEKSCGFICSREDLENWNPLEICHLKNTTKDLFGTLCDFLPEYTEHDIRNFVKMSLNNLYHCLCHTYIHGDMEKNRSDLPFHYKSVFFIFQNLHYLDTNCFVNTKKELLSRLNGINREVFIKSIEIVKDDSFDFEQSFKLLFSWCQETLKSI